MKKSELLRQRGNIITSLKDKISEDENLMKLFKDLNQCDSLLEKAKDLNDDDEIDENEEETEEGKEHKEEKEIKEKKETTEETEEEKLEKAKKQEENEGKAVEEALKILSEGELKDEQLKQIAEKYEIELEYLEDLIYDLISDDDEE